MYLLGDTSSQIGLEMDDRARAELVEEYFSSSGVGAPEVEGTLWLKAEAKKSWKKFHFVLRTSGLYYAYKGKKTSKDLVCLARFDVNQVYYGVKWQPKFKSPTKHCFAIKHPQIQAKNPKYIRYLCCDTEAELNKWVTGIRVAKYGKGLYDNFRGIVEEMAHDDLDELASSRFSADATALALTQNNNVNSVSSIASAGNGHEIVSAKASTPDSAHENKSFDSAFQMSDSQQTSAHSSTISAGSAPAFMHVSGHGHVHGHHGLSGTSTTTSAMVHTMPKNFHLNGGGSNGMVLKPLLSSQLSNSSASLSERSISSSTGAPEHGFSCDSPEGGTIKKKPSHNRSIANNHKSSSPEDQQKPKAKGVRFKETFATIPDPDPDPVTGPDMLPPPPPPSSGLDNIDTDKNRSIEDTLNIHRLTSTSNSFAFDGELECLPVPVNANGHGQNKLTRRYSDESLVSNPAMLHSATLISRPNVNNSASGGSPVKSPEPNRPAPVLKPVVGKKPSIDKGMLARKASFEGGHVSRPLVPQPPGKQLHVILTIFSDLTIFCRCQSKHSEVYVVRRYSQEVPESYQEHIFTSSRQFGRQGQQSSSRIGKANIPAIVRNQSAKACHST